MTLDVIYRLLGAVAALNQKMSRYRIRLVPSNWVLMIAGGIAVFACLDEVHHASVTGLTPRAVTLSSILAHDDMAHDYVTTGGTLDPSRGFSSDKDDYALLTDTKSSQGLLVEVPKSEMSASSPHAATITGIVRTMPTDLQKQLMTDGGRIGTTPIDTDYYLDEGAKPGNPALLTALAGLLSVVVALFFGTWLMKYIVFRREASTFQPGSLAMPDSGPTPPVSGLRATGRFYLTEKSARRFIHMPTSVGTTQDGHLAFMANVDTSPTLFGVKTQNRVGVWAMVITRGTVRVIEPGTHYFGWNGRPALRFQYVDGMSGKNALGLLSFGDQETRDIVARDLQDPTLKPPPPPPVPSPIA